MEELADHPWVQKNIFAGRESKEIEPIKLMEAIKQEAVIKQKPKNKISPKISVLKPRVLNKAVPIKK